MQDDDIWDIETANAYDTPGRNVLA